MSRTDGTPDTVERFPPSLPRTAAEAARRAPTRPGRGGPAPRVSSGGAPGSLPRTRPPLPCAILPVFLPFLPFCGRPPPHSPPSPPRGMAGRPAAAPAAGAPGRGKRGRAAACRRRGRSPGRHGSRLSGAAGPGRRGRGGRRRGADVTGLAPRSPGQPRARGGAGRGARGAGGGGKGRGGRAPGVAAHPRPPPRTLAPPRAGAGRRGPPTAGRPAPLPTPIPLRSGAPGWCLPAAGGGAEEKAALCAWGAARVSYQLFAAACRGWEPAVKIPAEKERRTRLPEAPPATRGARLRTGTSPEVPG